MSDLDVLARVLDQAQLNVSRLVNENSELIEEAVQNFARNVRDVQAARDANAFRAELKEVLREWSKASRALAIAISNAGAR